MLGEMEGAKTHGRARARAARVGRGGGQDRPAPRARAASTSVSLTLESGIITGLAGQVGSGTSTILRALGGLVAERLGHDRGQRREGAAQHAAARGRRGRSLHPQRPPARGPLPRADGRAQPHGHAAPPAEPARGPAAAPDPAQRARARGDDRRSLDRLGLAGRQPQRRQPAEGAARPGAAARGHGAARPRRADPWRRRRRAGRDPQARPRGRPQGHGGDLLLDGARRGARPRGRRRHDLRRADRLGRPAGGGVGLCDPRGHDDEPHARRATPRRERPDGRGHGPLRPGAPLAAARRRRARGSGSRCSRP